MFRRQGRPTTSGYLLALALAAAATLVFFLDDIVRAREETYVIIGVFSEVDGVDAGAEVRLAGHAAGRVAGVDLLPPDDSLPRFAVRLELPMAVRSLVRRDSELRLAATGLLTDPAVEILPGTAAAPALEPGDTLHARTRIRVESLLAATRATGEALDSLLARGSLLRDRVEAVRPDLDRLVVAARGARDELDTLARDVENGSLSALLADSAALAALDDAIASIAAAARAATDSARGAAPLGPALERLALRADTLGARVARLRALLERPRGFLGRWERDPAIRDAIAATRAQLDSLIAETRRRPWRYFF